MLLGDLSTASEQDMCTIWRWDEHVPGEASELCVVHELITASAQRYPERPAVCAWNGELTYAELDSLSTKLAKRLVRLGVNTGAVMRLCFEESMWEPVAMLAVMKAGGVSIAMDINLPEDRLREIARHTSGPAILSSTSMAPLAKVLVVDTNVVIPSEELSVDSGRCTPVVTEEAGHSGLPVVQSSSALYIVFTSGSTGIPKGAVITHANFSAAIRLQQQDFGISPASRVYDFASYA